MDRRIRFQPNNEIRHVVMHLVVVEIRNCKTETGIFDKGIYQRMRRR